MDAGRELAAARLMLVSPGAPAAAASLPQRARAAAEAGVDWIQIREKHLAAAALFRLVRDVHEAVRGTATRVLVNGRADVAVAAGVAGVHLPEDALPVREVRAAFPALVVGASCHSPAAAVRAEREGADYVVFGPVFATPGKEERAAGAAALAAVARAVRVPVYAIGGIDLATAAAARDAGARGLAAIRLFGGPPEALRDRVARLRARS